LEQGKEIDVVGASGALNFDPRTGEAPANIEEWKYTAAGGTTQVEVHTLDLAERRCRRTAGAPKSATTITVGVLLSFTTPDGGEDPWGDAQTNAIALAADEINSREGVNGRRKFHLVVCDTVDIAENAREQAAHLIRDHGAQALITGGSRETLAVAAEAVPKGVLVMSSSATSPELTELSDKQSPTDAAGLVWRTSPSDAIQGRVLADIVRADPTPNPRVAVLAVDEPYGQGLAQVFRSRYGTSNSRAFLFESGSNGADALTQAEAYAPTHVLLIGFPGELVPILKDVSANRPALKGAKWYFSDSAKALEVFNQVPDRAFLENAHGTAPASSDGPAFESFRSRYQSKFKADPTQVSFTANSYDAFYLVALAASYASTATGDKPITGVRMAEGLTKVSSGTPRLLEPLSYAGARGDMENGRSIDVEGASGKLDFDASTGEAPSMIEEWKYAGGAFSTVQLHDP
ncbi:MAG: ABC transporter substrate-binding protein, partial [Myxococcales bacterium]